VSTLISVRVGALAALVMLLSACGSTNGANSLSTPTPTPSTSPLACTSSGPASASWTPPDKRTSVTPAIVSAAAAGDILTLTFDQGTPTFEIKSQAGTHFVQDPSGKPIDVAGSAGAAIVLRGFRADMRNYAGPVSIISSGPRLLRI
jgi:hypothetical protein